MHCSCSLIEKSLSLSSEKSIFEEGEGLSLSSEKSIFEEGEEISFMQKKTLCTKERKPLAYAKENLFN
jgi:hypothetical protein